MKIKILILALFVGMILLPALESQAQIKITSLGELSEKPATGDFFVLVDVSDTTQGATGSTKKIQYSNVLKGVPWDFNWAIFQPANTMANVYTGRIQRAVSVSSMGCIVDPADSSESAVLDVYECDSNGDNCASIITQATCANTPTAATVNDSSLAANAFIKITVGTVTGTVTSLLIYGTGTQDW